MKRRMCKVCAKNNRDYYKQRKSTGYIVDVEKKTNETRRTFQCTECGHRWSYLRKK